MCLPLAPAEAAVSSWVFEVLSKLLFLFSLLTFVLSDLTKNQPYVRISKQHTT